VSSSFGWLDTDHTQRRRMLDVVDLFRERDTVDEIGVGAIRDTISDILFPGTSTLHTRMRYVLFVPWLVDMAVSSTTSSNDAAAKLRHLEIRLIDSLLRGEERYSAADNRGIIGSEARRNLKRMPSEMYWACLHRWGLRTTDMSLNAHLRHAAVARRLAAEQPEPDDPGARFAPNTSGFDLGGIDPPKDLLKQTNMDLTPEEAGLLTERLDVHASGSLLGWLTVRPHHIDPDAPAPWDLDLSGAPPQIRTAVEHAHRFSTLIHGARLLYNLLLAEAAEMPDGVDQLRSQLHEWRAQLERTAALDSWDQTDFWALLRQHQPRLSLPTQTFVDRWIMILSHTTHVEDDPDARDHLRSREFQIKGARARLHNSAALERWGRALNVSPLVFRWPETRRLLLDLHAPLLHHQAEF